MDGEVTGFVRVSRSRSHHGARGGGTGGPGDSGTSANLCGGPQGHRPGQEVQIGSLCQITVREKIQYRSLPCRWCSPDVALAPGHRLRRWHGDGATSGEAGLPRPCIHPGLFCRRNGSLRSAQCSSGSAGWFWCAVVDEQKWG